LIIINDFALFLSKNYGKEHPVRLQRYNEKFLACFSGDKQKNVISMQSDSTVKGAQTFRPGPLRELINNKKLS